MAHQGTGPRARVLRELIGGAADLGRGLRMWVTSPRLMLLGAIPAVLVGVLFLGGFVALVAALPHLVAAVTPFAGSWAAAPREVLRVAVGAGIVLLAGVVLLLAYTAVVLAIGDPCYERIARRVDESLGAPPTARTERMLTGLLRGVREGLVLLVAGAGVSLLALLIGLIPVAGPVLAAVVSACVGGRLVAVELTGFAFEARGLRLRDRRAALRARRSRATGFGVLAWLLLAVPVLSVVAMPAAVAGATILAREVLGETARAAPAPAATDA